MKQLKVIREVNKLFKQGYLVSQKYEIGDDYGFKEHNKLITLIIRKEYITKKKALDKIFNTMYNECIKPDNEDFQPFVEELGWRDSIEWLTRYPYGYTDNANCILIDGHSRILGINYNGLSNNDFIVTTGHMIIPDYIIINNSKKLEGVYYKKDLSDILRQIKNIF